MEMKYLFSHLASYIIEEIINIDTNNLSCTMCLVLYQVLYSHYC